MLRRKATGPAMMSANSSSMRGYISSGPHDLFTFNFKRCSLTISTVMLMSCRTEFVLLSMIGVAPSGSFVNTDENCFCKIFAFSLSLNLRELLFFTSSSRGATLHFVFNFLRVCNQNAFGLLFERCAIPFSNNLFDFLSRVFALFHNLV